MTRAWSPGSAPISRDDAVPTYSCIGRRVSALGGARRVRWTAETARQARVRGRPLEEKKRRIAPTPGGGCGARVLRVRAAHLWPPEAVTPRATCARVGGAQIVPERRAARALKCVPNSPAFLVFLQSSPETRSTRATLRKLARTRRRSTRIIETRAETD